MKSRKVWIVSLCLLAVLGLWIHSRFDAWFKNLPEPPYEALEAPGRLLLTFGSEDGLSRNVSWQCGTEVLPSHLELVDVAAGDTSILPAKGEVFVSRSGQMAYYHAPMRQLKADATYRYRVATGTQTSDWQTFRTHNGQSQTDFSFLYFGDVQDSIGGCFGNYLQAAMERHPETEFLLFGGDLTERPMDCYWAEAFRALGPWAASCPLLTVTGNHDYLKSFPLQLERRFPLIHSYYLDSMIGRNLVYTVRYNNLQLFLLDSTHELPYLWQQRQWLDRALAASDAPWKIVVLHHPLYSLKGSRNNLIQRWVFDPIIRRHNVQLVLQGHEHAFARLLPPADGSAPAYLVSHCSPKRYDICPDGRYDVYGLDSRYYQQVRITPEVLAVRTFDAQSGALVDSFELKNSTTDGSANMNGQQTDLLQLTDWDQSCTLPDVNGVPNPGLAGAFSGFVGNRFILAGGANFPDKMPWNGGKKQWHDRLYAISLDETNAHWQVQNGFLPQPMGYGASIQLENSLLCIGGADPDTCYQTVFEIKWEQNQFVIDSNWPSLPCPLSNATASRAGNRVFIAGGQSSMHPEQATHHLFMLDLTHREKGWQSITPWPGAARGFAVSCAVETDGSTRFYLFGGRNYQPDGTMTVLTDGYAYDTKRQQWHQLKPEFPVMAGTAFLYESGKIVLLGGVPQLIPGSDEHPGFDNQVRLYDPVADSLTTLATSPFPIPVTTSVTYRKGRFYVGSGEIKPGMRTPHILSGRITSAQKSIHYDAG